jgi:hypothetical protein
MYVPFSVFGVLFVCKCVMYCCHRVSTQLRLNISSQLYPLWAFVACYTAKFTVPAQKKRCQDTIDVTMQVRTIFPVWFPGYSTV